MTEHLGNNFDGDVFSMFYPVTHVDIHGYGYEVEDEYIRVLEMINDALALSVTLGTRAERLVDSIDRGLSQLELTAVLGDGDFSSSPILAEIWGISQQNDSLPTAVSFNPYVLRLNIGRNEEIRRGKFIGIKPDLYGKNDTEPLLQFFHLTIHRCLKTMVRLYFCFDNKEFDAYFASVGSRFSLTGLDINDESQDVINGDPYSAILNGLNTFLELYKSSVVLLQRKTIVG